MHQRGRGVIQQVSVVDTEDQWTPAAPLGDQGRGPTQGVQTVIAQVLGRRQQVGDRPERDRGGRPGRGHPLHIAARRLDPRQGLSGHPGLADPGSPSKHHAATSGIPDVSDQRLKLDLAPDQRPRHIHAAILYRPIRPIE